MNFQTCLSEINSFFEIFKKRWLNTNELLAFLSNVKEILKRNLMQVITNLDLSSCPQSGSFFIMKRDFNTWKNDGLNWRKKIDGSFQESSNILKVKGTKQIQCFYYTLSENPNYKKRCYYLIHFPEYILVHYIEENFLKKKLQANKAIEQIMPPRDLLSLYKNDSHIKIIDFAPNQIFENTTSKILIIIESYLNFQNLKMLENQIQIKFGQISYMPCKIINSTTISSIIPYSSSKEIKLEIYLGEECISVCDQELKLKYLPQKLTEQQVNQVQPSNINFAKNKNTIGTYGIFNLSNSEIKKRLRKLLLELKWYIVFYTNGKSELKGRKESDDEINEENLICEIGILLKELITVENGSKKKIIYKFDEFGYNIIHYICALNYYNTLVLFAKYHLKLFEQSKDGLTPYEICAGMWHYESLLKLIELIDLHDNEEMNSDLDQADCGRIIYNIDTLRSALDIALDRGKSMNNKNVDMLELLLKQIKIQFTVDSTSGTIINAINGNLNIQDTNYQFSNGHDENAKYIQKYVRGWLRRSRYNGIKKAKEKLQSKIKNFVDRKKFLNIKNATIKIQKTFRNWMNNHHDHEI